MLHFLITFYPLALLLRKLMVRVLTIHLIGSTPVALSSTLKAWAKNCGPVKASRAARSGQTSNDAGTISPPSASKLAVYV